MAITAAMVKDLRDRTGAGMMDCKKALVATEGDMEKAIDFLREKGMAKAAKKAGRATGEGIITTAASADGKTVVLGSLLCETDFVSKGDDFRGLAAKVADVVLASKPASVEDLTAAMGADVTALIAKVGENMKFGPFAIHEVAANGAVGVYIHANKKIGVLVDFECGNPATAETEGFKKLAKEVAMQVAAQRPMALDRDSLDPAAIERERQIYRKKFLEEGKPEKIVDKIAEGAVQKFFKDVCLVDQAYIRDDKKSVAQLVKEVAKELGDTVAIKGFTRLDLADVASDAEAAE